MVNSYQIGRNHALLKLGFSVGEFAEFAQGDETDGNANVDTEHALAQPKGVDKTPAWSGQNSLEAGDAGTRNYQLGLPRVGAV